MKRYFLFLSVTCSLVVLPQVYADDHKVTQTASAPYIATTEVGTGVSSGSEWRLHRQWFETTALPDLLEVDARSAQDDTLHRCCHDYWLEHKEAPFAHLRVRWADLFGVRGAALRPDENLL